MLVRATLGLIALTTGLVNGCTDAGADNYGVADATCAYPPTYACNEVGASNYVAPVGTQPITLEGDKGEGVKCVFVPFLTDSRPSRCESWP